MIKSLFFAAMTALHFWRIYQNAFAPDSDSYELEHQAARLREIERHPELLTGGPSEWERRH